MPTNSIICPSCSTTISLDEALTAQIKSSLMQEVEEQTKQQAIHLRQQEETLKSQMEQLLKDKASLDEQLHIRLAEERKTLEQQLKQRLVEESKVELKFLEDQLAEQKQKNQEAIERELLLRKKEEMLEEQQRNLKLELQRQMDEERKHIREKTEMEMIEQQRQKDMEKEKVIADLRKALDDAQRKAQQGSQQTQGEVQELALEEMLRQTFTDDIIEPVGKGVTGADIRQIVRTPRGTICGKILWESKQTKTWSDGWIGKLKADMRNDKADIPIIVTSAFQDPHWPGMVLKEGVWICSFKLALPLAVSLRRTLIEIGREKAMSADRGNKADMVYSYVTSQAFRQQIEAVVEVFYEMQTQIAKEKAAMERIWKQREGQAQRVLNGMANVYGSIQGIAGASAIPQLKGLELLDDGDESGNGIPQQQTLLG